MERLSPHKPDTAVAEDPQLNLVPTKATPVLADIESKSGSVENPVASAPDPKLHPTTSPIAPTPRPNPASHPPAMPTASHPPKSHPTGTPIAPEPPHAYNPPTVPIPAPIAPPDIESSADQIQPSRISAAAPSPSVSETPSSSSQWNFTRLQAMGGFGHPKSWAERIE